MMTPAPDQPSAPVPAEQPKTWNCCLWGVLVQGLFMIILGIVMAALGGFAGTTTAGIMLLIVGVLAIPPFIAKAHSMGKSLVVTFGIIALILSIIAGILAGWTGFWGAVIDSICKDWRDNKSNFYVCSPVSSTSYCTGYSAGGVQKSYTLYTDCTKYSKAGDQDCCTKMKSAKKTSCITADQEDTCKKAGASWVGGIIGIVTSILGCIAGCLGLVNCCNGYYDTAPANMQMGPVPGAAPVVVATPVQGTLEAAPVADAAPPAPPPPVADGATPPPPPPPPPPDKQEMSDPSITTTADSNAAARGCCGTGP